MSTCPEKDIHSVYLDGELPEKYRSEYEAHIASCQKCKAVLDKMRALHTMFAQDADGAQLDSVFMQQSFERLQTKLRYSANVQKAAERQHVLSFPAVRWGISAAAAAAVFAVLFTPVYLRTQAGTAAPQELKTIASAELEPLSEKKIVVDGNISHKDLSSLAVAKQESETKEDDADTPKLEQRTVRATATVSTPSGASMRRSLTSVDVFKPEGVNAASSLPIKIAPPIPYYSGEER